MYIKINQLKGVYMLRITNLIGAIALGFLSFNGFAADIPQADVEAQDFNQSECVNDNAQTCINDRCLTSEATDCQDQCRTQAEAVCEQKAAE